MLKVLIIEDEKLSAEKLEMLLKESSYEISILGRCHSVEESLSWLEENNVDLIFCDIHLTDGSAFEIFDQIDIRTPVIFTTAYDQYALRAFEHNSVDYLLKPIDEGELAKSLKKFAGWQGTPGNFEELKQLSEILKLNYKNYRERFLVTIGRRIEMINSREVAYFYSQNKQTFLMLKDGKKLPFDKSLNSLMAELDPKKYFHLNRHLILSIDCIQQIYRVSKHKTMLKIDPPSPVLSNVSEMKLAALKRWLNS